jgi:hypothetical protein
MGLLQTILVMILMVAGCEFSPPANPFSAEVEDKSGNHRLALIYTPSGVGPIPGSQAYDFDSLVWRFKVGTNWSNRIVITKQQFEAGSPTRRRVSEIYSIDPTSGNAVIKVAEGSYTWREWNLLTNHEVKLLRVCKEPFEPFNPSLGYRIKRKLSQ